MVCTNYLYSAKDVQCMFLLLSEYWQNSAGRVASLLWKVYEPIDCMERAYFKLKNLGILFNQVCFFMMAEKVLVPDQKVTCLYTLMFYNVFAYCVAYIKELVEKEDWSPYINITNHSNIRHLAMSATKIVLEWTKAVTFIITIVFMLLVFSLETVLDNYRPTISYTLVTFMYYLLTEKVFVDLLTILLNHVQVSAMENMESLWLPVIFQFVTAGAGAILLVPLVIWGPYRVAFIGAYGVVYLRIKDSYLSNLNDLITERALISPYRYATLEELSTFDDVCAVCLNPMKVARITPCHHIFHGDCLRKWVKTSNHCPLCKRELKFD